MHCFAIQEQSDFVWTTFSDAVCHFLMFLEAFLLELLTEKWFLGIIILEYLLILMDSLIPLGINRPRFLSQVQQFILLFYGNATEGL